MNKRLVLERKRKEYQLTISHRSQEGSTLTDVYSELKDVDDRSEMLIHYSGLSRELQEALISRKVNEMFGR